jgi:hypothetical protein
MIKSSGYHCYTNFAATVYVGEMVNSNLRGMFGSSLAFSVSLGLQYVVAVGEITPGVNVTNISRVAILHQNYNTSIFLEFNLRFLA